MHLALLCLLHSSFVLGSSADADLDLQECIGEACDKVAPWTEGEEGLEGMEMLQQKASAKAKSSSAAQSEAEAEMLALQEIRRSWREGGNCTAKSRGVGTHAPIAPHGYYTVANLCCNYQMEYYITRAILTLGYKVCDQGAVMGLVPWHSCRGAQSLQRLFEDIHAAAPGVTTCPFVQKSDKECPTLGAECNAASKTYANTSYHRRRVCGINSVADFDNYGKKPGSSGSGSGDPTGPTYIPGGTSYIPGGKWTPGTTKNVYQGPVKPNWPTPAPAPSVLPCRATFENVGGTRILQQWAGYGAKGEESLDEACCALCNKHAGCTHWVRESASMGPVKCWLQENAAHVYSKSNTLRGGWKKPKKCGGDKTCNAAFSEMSGTRIKRIGVCGSSNAELDAACCYECRKNYDCEFWQRDVGEKGTLGCQLMRNPGTEYKDRPLTRGGFKQGCGPFPADDAMFQELNGGQIKRLVICGETTKDLDAACSYLCDQDETCEHWVRDVVSPWKAYSANMYCYLRKGGNQVQSANVNRRGGYNKKCGTQKFDRCGASFQDLAGTLVENQRVCGKTDQELDAACCDKCRQNSLCHFWVREKANSGFRHCWLRRDERGNPAVSAARRGGYKESQACGDAYLNINCKATFQQMSGTEVLRKNVCGKNDAELDAHCCFLCRNFTSKVVNKEHCEFWVRDIRKATDGAERPVMCYLRKDPGGGSKNVNLRGGWKMPCKRQVPECKATFMDRGGPQVDKIGVCGIDQEHLDAQCCNECAKHPDCEFWVRETNNPDYRHGAANSSFCYLRKLGALNPANNANRRGGWNRICGSPDTPACWASFQEAGGAQVEQVRVCGKDDSDLDSECCAKCKKNLYCDYWVREKGSSGYKWCWLRKLPANGKLAKSPNANRRGGWPQQMICGDKYASNGCRSTFKEMSGAQVAFHFACGKTAAELDAHCCELCRNHTNTAGVNDCSFWVREVPKTTDGALRPMTCWLRKNPGNGGNNALRAGGWKQGCGNEVTEHKAEFMDRGGAQIEKVGVCAETQTGLDSECSDLCAKNPQCEFWVREVNYPTIAQGGTNTQFCYLRKNGAVNPSNNANKRGAWNRICGSLKAPFTCAATFQEMAGPQISVERVCGKTDGALDAECCERCRDHEFCDYWVREKGTGYQNCYLRRFHPNGQKVKSAHGNRRGGMKASRVCGSAYLDNGCRSTFKEMGGAQSKLEFTCGKNDNELDAMCCALCRNDTKCEFWVREIRQPSWAPTRPVHCWLRYNTGNPSNNNNRRGGWRQGCTGNHAECKAGFQERGGAQVKKLGVCGKTNDELDAACCDLCKKNPDCEFWVREVNYPAVAHGGSNTQFCYLRKNGALTSSNSNTKRGAWNPLRCSADVVVPCKAAFQDWAGDQVELHRVCGLSDAAIDAQCCKLCRDNILCEYWVRETRATGGNTGFWNCWLRRNGRMTGNANVGFSRNQNANVNRRGGFQISEPCGDAFVDNKCKASFKQLGGSQAAYTFVCGSNDDELDAHCCAKCRNHTKCEYWVREAGTSGSKQCWLRYNPGGFQNHHSYRGAPREGCGSQNQRKAEFQEWPGPEVDRFPVCGANNDELDGACGDKCAGLDDCEYWVRESGSTGFKMCWLRKIPQGNARGSGARRGGFKTCRSGELDVFKAQFQNHGGSHIATTRICGKNNDEWDSHCSERCSENMDCVMWLRQAGNDGGNSNYKYCWLYKNPTTVSNHPHRRGGYKPQKFANENCEATFKDMPGRQTFQVRIWGASEKVLDAACCDHCTKSFACDFWVREQGHGIHVIGGKWCWLRMKTTENPTKQNNNNRRGGMKIPKASLLEGDSVKSEVQANKEQDVYEKIEDAEKADMEEAEDIDAEQNALEYGEEDTPTEEQEAEALAQNKAAFKELTGEELQEDDGEETPEDVAEGSQEAEEVIPVHELGQKASLDEQGYKAVAAIKDNKQMEKFIRRAAQAVNMEIHDEGGLQGILPFYSGVKAVQTYEALLLELERTGHSGPGAWVQLPTQQ